MYAVIDQSEWSDEPGRWHGEIELGAHGGGLCLIFNQIEPGTGPRLHKHPYAETFIIRAGRAVFTVGNEMVEAAAGQIVVVAANVPHKFVNPGPGILETIDIHGAGSFTTEWLE